MDLSHLCPEEPHDGFEELTQGKAGNSCLLNELGNMCCLGFASKAAGVTASDLLDREAPSELRIEYSPPGIIQLWDIETDAIELNDNWRISNKTREAKLKKLFSTAGIELKFEGSSRGLR